MEKILKNLEVLTSMLVVLIKVGVEELKKTPHDFDRFELKTSRRRERSAQRKINKIKNTKPNDRYMQSEEDLKEALEEAKEDLKEALEETEDLLEKKKLKAAEHAAKLKILEEAGL
jgi:excinuclease UvrABC helicase subunit UvrB